MTRIQRSALQRRRKKLKITKGFRGASSLLYKNANQQFLKAFRCAFKDRRIKKRSFRTMWIRRINAKVRQSGFNYHSFVYKNRKIQTKLNRKMLAQLALYDF
uniref:50S ribosomal protein L20 n=1 Tax=Pseudocodium devriesii TaxID=453070 RepID=A0A386B138_9CHLO|nr:ribosomal protein L20 [Pseudocodium devriesii]AYC65407.1 ribosomal protein L20 [Pseudocodium devriesii]